MADDTSHNVSWWQETPEGVLVKIGTSLSGLSNRTVLERQKQYGLNVVSNKKTSLLEIFIRQFTGNPLIIILAIATIAAFFLGQHDSSYYILGIIVASVLLGLWNEYSATKTVEDLLKKISPTALVEREGEKLEVPVSHLTIGDIVLLSQGTIIPADLRLIESNDLEVNQSALTGEAKTVFKTDEGLPEPPKDNANIDNFGYMGTSVVSGTARGVVLKIGKDTAFGRIAETTSFVRPVTDFQKGLAKFGDLIIKVILVMTVIIFLVNWLLGHTFINSLLFSLAIAVGLTPELLPVIVTVSLAHGAGKLAKKHIVVKQLISIENLGNMDVLCTDKTGTITEGRIDVVDYFDAQGEKSPAMLQYSLLCNSAIVHHKVLGNAIDVSLWEHAIKNKIGLDSSFKKIDVEEFDYNRKCMYAVVEQHGERMIVVKGAPDNTIALCKGIHDKEALHKRLLALNDDGLRMVAIATMKVAKKQKYTWADVKDLHFEGYITFLDIPKKSAKEALDKLHSLNVATKIITGDNEVITQKICREVGIAFKQIMLGSEIEHLSDEALMQKVNDIDIFARVTPDQKLRIINTLQKHGHTVGYLGDGINDLPSLHSADVGISVNTAVDVAKDTAAVVLLHKSLDVIADGIIEGRKTFNNTIKYILMATSSNFGNMFSAAGASFFLPFLPMTPVQILLTNGLYDVSQLSIPSDNVDPEALIKPRHWNIDFIKDYMIFFGPLSSIFDYATFGVMLFIFHAKGPLFQTGWFIESIATEILVVFLIRTYRSPFFLSRPSKWLSATCLSLASIGILLPFTPLARTLGLVVPPFKYFGILIILIACYLTLVELVKHKFLKKHSM
ncbi:MAG TPA: magnesium-translocating P-type ATPase [Candidatus Saccharimonadales bacterium]|nr:magnesium-translocating P-type ATPase [Candidatus Saccharimonadales bacterium]